MKKILTVAIAVLMLAFSVMPALAVESPSAPTSYRVVTVNGDGVFGQVIYITDIQGDGTQRIAVKVTVTDNSYDFTGLEIDGDYVVTSGSLTDSYVELLISSDLTVNVTSNKSGEETNPTGTGTTTPATTSPSGDKKTDDSNKSPQTGSQDSFIFIVLGLSAAALAAGVIVAKRRSSEK